MTTTWKDIPNYDGWYQASDTGQIRSWRSRGYGAGRRLETPVILTGKLRNGYRSVKLRHDGCVSHRRVNRLVLLTFLGPSPLGKSMACHSNGDRLDNRPSNLYWGSAKDNSDDAFKHGTRISGERHPMARLVEADILKIRERYSAGGTSHSKLADEFGVSKALIQKILVRKLWSHV